ncbi:MAG: thioesterase family protein [Pirellulaceae bacterium]|nr:thioesterase family protein [Pirellulaceae bacterium]
MNEQSPQQPPACPVVLTIPVQWGDQDAFGHVNNTHSIRWFESARMEYFDLDPIVQLLQGTRVGPILVSIHCDYRQQLSHPETIQVTARISKIGRTSMVIEHQIFSHQQQVLISEGYSTIVLFDYAKNEPVPVSEELRQAIESLEGRSLDSST